MGLFDKFMKKAEAPKSGQILAPLSGEMIPASQISDAVFSEEMMGQTIGFIPTDGTVVCPVDGVVSVMFPTGHAFGIETKEGNGYLVHIGIDTVSLNGEGFEVLIKQGDTVKAGQKAVIADFDKIKEAGLSTTTMLIVTDKATDDYVADYIDFGSVERGQVISR